MKTAGTLFTGGGGVDIALKQAGYEVLFGLEYMQDIAEVAIQNLGNHIRVADILTQDPHDYPKVDVLHASPPCPNYSIAKKGGKETAHDIALAEKVAEFIRVLQPKIFTLENVRGYVKSESYKIIMKQLSDLGYMVDSQVVNSADFGVPQTRLRLIVRATHGLLPQMPEKVKWVGWYEAIEDLIPTLPESKFADWQLKRLPKELKDSIAWVNQNQNTGGKGYRAKEEPSNTDGVARVTQAVAYIVNNQQSDDHKGGTYGVTGRNNEEPVMTISSSFVPKAVLVGTQHTGNFEDGTHEVATVESDKPSASVNAHNAPKAVLIGGGNRSNSFLEFAEKNRPDTPGKRFDDEPSHSVSATASQDTRAFLVNASNTMETRDEESPSATLVADARSLRQRAFIMPNGNASGARPFEQEEPHPTVSIGHDASLSRAFIVSSTEMRTDTPKDQQEPIGTIKSQDRMPRAFVMAGGDSWTDPKEAGEPIYTVTDSKANHPNRPFLMQVQGEGGDGIKEVNEPMQTVTQNHGAGKYRAYLQYGRVVQMTPRALARFQSFPDWYLLPEKKTLACKIIGNAVPCLMMKKIYEQFG